MGVDWRQILPFLRQEWLSEFGGQVVAKVQVEDPGNAAVTQISCQWVCHWRLC